eukprot:1748639-Pleurochrysis_carterae.AAC.3
MKGGLPKGQSRRLTSATCCLLPRPPNPHIFTWMPLASASASSASTYPSAIFINVGSMRSDCLECWSRVVAQWH